MYTLRLVDCTWSVIRYMPWWNIHPTKYRMLAEVTFSMSLFFTQLFLFEYEYACKTPFEYMPNKILAILWHRWFNKWISTSAYSNWAFQCVLMDSGVWPQYLASQYSYWISNISDFMNPFAFLKTFTRILPIRSIDYALFGAKLPASTHYYCLLPGLR